MMIDEYDITLTEEQQDIIRRGGVRPIDWDLVEGTFIIKIPSGGNTSSEILGQLGVLHDRLRASDYKAIKHAEGWLTDEEYAETKAQRQAWRDEINRLESLLAERENQ